MHTTLQKMITLFFAALLLLGSSNVIAVDTVKTQLEFAHKLDDLDKRHQIFSKYFYRTLLKQPKYRVLKFPTLNALQVEINKAPHEKTHKSALIINNINMLRDYYDDPSITPLIQTLLDTNALFHATILLNILKDQDDDTLTAQADYLLADFYFQRELWKKTLDALESEMSFLSAKQYYHALLIKGISLQKLGEHYKAIKVYEKIPASSTSYTAARLNLAIANLRQGWWTDAHIIIKSLLKVQQETPQEVILNRLYITLGYSLLNQGYYRTARSTFHQVGIDSSYANQAILGIALTAAQQGDDIGALNATRFLKARQQDDLPVHESYLLMPFFYEKSNQLVPASVGYNEASDYYTKKIRSINELIKSPLKLTEQQFDLNSDITLSLEGNIIHLSKFYPQYYFNNRSTMQTYQSHIENKKLRSEYQALNDNYDFILIQMSRQILQKRADNLNSYLNQSRFGLARLFDNNTAE